MIWRQLIDCGTTLDISSFRFFASALFLMLIIAFPSTAYSALKVAYVDVPPYAYQSQSNQASGLLIDKIRHIFTGIDTDIEFVYLPHRRLINFIETGQVDIWAGQGNSRLGNEHALVSKTPLFTMDLQVYWRNGTPEVNSFEDLKGKNTLLISSYSYNGRYQELIDNSSTVNFVVNHADGFDKLFSKKDRYLLGYKKISEEIIHKYDIKHVSFSTLVTTQLYLKISRSSPNADITMRRINMFLKKPDGATE